MSQHRLPLLKVVIAPSPRHLQPALGSTLLPPVSLVGLQLLRLALSKHQLQQQPPLPSSRPSMGGGHPHQATTNHTLSC